MEHRSPISRSISYLLVGLIALFALSSFGNVQAFVERYHAGWTSYAVAGGFSLSVFVCAYLAATAKTSSTRWRSIASALVFGVVSGYFQMILYRKGDGDAITPALLSFIPLVVGEVGLALVEAAYSQEHEPSQSNTVNQEAIELQNQLNDLQKQFNGMIAERDALQNQFNESAIAQNLLRNELDELRTTNQGIQTQFDEARRRLNDLKREFEQFAPDSILSRLDEAKRQKLSELLALVESQRIQSPGDLIKHGMPKADVYGLWPVAMAARLIYPNGDDSYHARK